MDDIEESAATGDAPTHGIDQEDGSCNAPTSHAREPYQRQTTVEEEDDDDDEMAMEVREEGAVAKVSKYIVPEWVFKFFRTPERQSYFALATFIGKEMTDYYISILIIFLIQFLGMHQIRAVIIKNFQEGGSRALAIFVAYFTDVYVGHFWMLLLSASLYPMGFGILHCLYQKFTKEQHVTRWPFYFALILITIGISGVEFSLRGFEPKERRMSPRKPTGNHGRIHWKRLFTMRSQWKIFRIIALIISSFMLPFFDFAWPRIFLIFALMKAISLIFLLLSILFYTPRKPYISRRLSKKAASIKTESDPDLTTQQEGPSSHQNPSIKKGSIRRTSQPVEENKVLIHILPMSIPFIGFGMVVVLGETLFLAQASTMRISNFGADVLKVGADGLAIQVFVIASKIGSYGTAAAYDLIAKKIGVAKKRGCDAIKLGLAMALPILCCAIASAVATKGLGHQMNVYWLVPQFFFLGAMDKVAMDGIEGFFNHETAPTMKRYAPVVAYSMTGVGVLLCIPFQLRFIRKAYEGPKDNEMVLLKKFYIRLTVLSAVNFLLYVVLALFYMYWKRKPEKEEESQVNSEASI